MTIQAHVDDAEPISPSAIPVAVHDSLLEMLEDNAARAERARVLHAQLQELIGTELAEAVAGCIEGDQGPPAPWGKAGVRRVNSRHGLMLDAIEALVAARPRPA